MRPLAFQVTPFALAYASDACAGLLNALRMHTANSPSADDAYTQRLLVGGMAERARGRALDTVKRSEQRIAQHSHGESRIESEESEQHVSRRATIDS